jgi:hypothetical protein
MATRRGFLVTTLALSTLPPALMAGSCDTPTTLKVISEPCLEHRLLRISRDWVRRLADSFDVLAATGGGRETRTLTAPVSHVDQSRHLVSWMLRRYPAWPLRRHLMRGIPACRAVADRAPQTLCFSPRAPM